MLFFIQFRRIPPSLQAARCCCARRCLDGVAATQARALALVAAATKILLSAGGTNRDARARGASDYHCGKGTPGVGWESMVVARWRPARGETPI